MNTSRGTELGTPRGDFFFFFFFRSSKIQQATAFALGGRSAPQLRAEMSSPEPRITSDSTTRAGGSSRALIGPSAQRRRGLWGNRDWSCGLEKEVVEEPGHEGP